MYNKKTPISIQNNLNSTKVKNNVDQLRMLHHRILLMFIFIKIYLHTQLYLFDRVFAISNLNLYVYNFMDWI